MTDTTGQELRLGDQVDQRALLAARELVRALPGAGAQVQAVEYSPQGLVLVTDGGWRVVIGEARDLNHKLAGFAAVVDLARQHNLAIKLSSTSAPRTGPVYQLAALNHPARLGNRRPPDPLLWCRAVPIIAIRPAHHATSTPAALLSPLLLSLAVAVAVALTAPDAPPRPESPERIVARARLIAGLDIGTTKTCAVLAEQRPNGRLQFTAAGVCPSRGLRKGVVVSLDETSASVEAAVEQCERRSGHRIGSALVSVAGSHIESQNTRGVTTLANHGSDLTGGRPPEGPGLGPGRPRARRTGRSSTSSPAATSWTARRGSRTPSG